MKDVVQSSPLFFLVHFMSFLKGKENQGHCWSLPVTWCLSVTSHPRPLVQSRGGCLSCVERRQTILEDPEALPPSILHHRGKFRPLAGLAP